MLTVIGFVLGLVGWIVFGGSMKKGKDAFSDTLNSIEKELSEA